MGFRFRKSIKLPGGFRINASKSGIGYSWGTKGFRVTKTAKGTTRTTTSIPGTGISYVTESKSNKRPILSSETEDDHQPIQSEQSVPTYTPQSVSEPAPRATPWEVQEKDWVDKIAPVLPLVYVLWFCGIAAGTFFLLSLIFK